MYCVDDLMQLDCQDMSVCGNDCTVEDGDPVRNVNFLCLFEFSSKQACSLMLILKWNTRTAIISGRSPVATTTVHSVDICFPCLVLTTSLNS